MIKTRIISSLEKPLLQNDIESFPSLKSLSALQNERVSFQLLFTSDAETVHVTFANLKVESPIRLSVRSVEQVPVLFPVYESCTDEQYLSKEPGLYPDLLAPTQYDQKVCIVKNQLHSVWITLDTELFSGDFQITCSLLDDQGQPLSSDVLQLQILPIPLPKQSLLFTEWFHCDCLASYYHVPVFSEEHWSIIKNFMLCARQNGINMILTPIFTPPLDTEIGRERPTTQLIQISKDESTYNFDYSLFDRWVALCHECDIDYFEISHLFTQWGAAHAPKIVANVHGEMKRIFGWDTDAVGPEYRSFLESFLPSFVQHIRTLGIDQHCYFHISDEPNIYCLEAYKQAKAVVEPLLEGYPIMDAMSNLEFYQQGICSMPIPGNNHIQPFLDAQIPNLWTYYCCAQHTKVSNRFIAMPSVRNRCIGSQLFKFNICGFLQWGFNYYFNMGSRDLINPYLDASGANQVPAGDSFQVYPGVNGQPLESIRLAVFNEALQDLRAMQLCEQYYSHDEIVRDLEAINGEIRFDRCPTDAQIVLDMRACINRMIADKLN